MINYNKLLAELNGARLVIVSKTRTDQQIMQYYNLGHRHFGENRAQELLTKIHLPQDICWHFIGHLQTNKVKHILPYVYSIDSVDSLELLSTIDAQSSKIQKITNCLVQLNLAEEITKSGLKKDQIPFFMENAKKFSHIKINGFMCIGPHCDDPYAINDIFAQAYEIYLQYAQAYDLTILSMGMSHDYPIALKNHATEVRLGSLLF